MYLFSFLSGEIVMALINSAVAGEVQSLPELTGELLQISLSLLIVLIIIMLSAWLLNRFIKINANKGSYLKFLGALSLGGRERVILIQVNDRQILLGVAPGSVQMLYAIEPSSNRSSPKFSNILDSQIHDDTQKNNLAEIKDI